METIFNDGLAKMVLKICLEGKSSVRITIASINKDFIRKKGKNDYFFFQDEDCKFTIWSTQDFIFNERQLRLPDDQNLCENIVYLHEFKHDIERYEVLKKLYITLRGWSREMDRQLKNYTFNNFLQNSNKKYNNKVTVVGDYWYVS
jgi:hypothetical protein